MTVDLSPTAVDLAREPPFRLGGLEVRPAVGELEWPGGRETLQPRVMQVLVTLARSRGEVVSRDALVEACWGGRVVGDDAIHRCMAHLRRLSERTGGFTVETIPRVGHRLIVAAPKQRRTWLPSLAWPLLGLVTLAIAATGFWWLHNARASAPRVEVAALAIAGGGAEVRGFAQRTAADITGFLNEGGVQTATDQKPAEFRVDGTIREESGRLYMRLFLKQPRARVTLWTREINGPAADSARLSEQAAAAAADAVWLALEPRRQRGLKLDPETLALHVRAGEVAMRPPPFREGEARQLSEQIVARAPRFAAGRGHLAVALASEATIAPQAERAALRARARREAEAAIDLDPSTAGAAYHALYQLSRQERPTDILAAEDVLLAGLRQAPRDPFLNMRECRLLTEVGRPADAMAYCRRAVALRPLAAASGYSYAQAIYVDGDLAQADRAIDLTLRRDPEHGYARLARFEFAALSGSAEKAQQLLHDPATAPQFISSTGNPALDAFLKARTSGRADDADAASQALVAAGEDGRVDVRLAARALVALGRVDDAFAMLSRPGPRAVLAAVNNGFLLEPSTAPLRRDARFWALAERAGLTTYWLRRDAWPDFCQREMALEACRVAAKAVAAPSVQGQER